MKKEDLILALANTPDNTDIEVTLRDSNTANDLSREVISVERRRDSKTGNEVINLICFKSLKEQRQYDKKVSAKAKHKKQATAKEAPQDRPTPDFKPTITGKDLPRMIKEQLAKLETAQQGNSPDNFSQ